MSHSTFECLVLSCYDPSLILVMVLILSHVDLIFVVGCHCHSLLINLKFFIAIGFCVQNISPFSLTPPRTPELKASDSCSNSDVDVYRSNYLTVPGQQIASGDSCYSLYDLDQVKITFCCAKFAHYY